MSLIWESLNNLTVDGLIVARGSGGQESASPTISEAIVAATSRGKRLMRLAEKGVSSICSGAASPMPMRQASERIRRCIQNNDEPPAALIDLSRKDAHEVLALAGNMES